MLKDRIHQTNLPDSKDLSVVSNIEVKKIFEFVDKNLTDFCTYYKPYKDSEKENRISDLLVFYFEGRKSEMGGGFFPYVFGKGPTQPDSDKEVDIGVRALTTGMDPTTIVEFEAKRLSDTSNNREYVCGDRGGIERFKRGKHSSHLSQTGKFGYVQSKSAQHWIDKINEWIKDLSDNCSDPSISWKGNKQRLKPKRSLKLVEKLSSKHCRIGGNDIAIFHYFIDLTSEANPANSAII